MDGANKEVSTLKICNISAGSKDQVNSYQGHDILFFREAHCTIVALVASRIFCWKNLQNAAYPEIVFCYIARKFAYFILPHIVLYRILFSITFFLSELCRSVLTKMPIFFAFIFFPVTYYFVSYFVLMHKLIIIF